MPSQRGAEDYAPEPVELSTSDPAHFLREDDDPGYWALLEREAESRPRWGTDDHSVGPSHPHHGAFPGGHSGDRAI